MVSDKPTLRAATTIGASEELPFGVHFITPSSSFSFESVVLQHKMAASRLLFTPMSFPLLDVLPLR